jgi:hypothetical protein
MSQTTSRHAGGQSVHRLLKLLEEGYRAPAWHGPNLVQALRGVTADEALWRPTKERHNIWELAIHCAYWKYTVRRRTLRASGLHFPLSGSNWFRRDRGTEKEWKSALRILRDEHHALLATVLQPPADAITRRRAAVECMWQGAALHDVYHAGQIVMLKKIARERAQARRRSKTR